MPTLATWNVNSIRARRDRVLAWTERVRPDILCLQEIKVTEEHFPFADFDAIGYEAAVYGQKTYNGVAILSRTPICDIRRGLDDGVDDPQARLLDAVVADQRVLCVYVPNGREVGSDKYDYKLAWLERLRGYLERTASPEEALLVCGDMNVAPERRDAAFPDQWEGSVLCHEDARTALARVRAWGLADLYRELHPDGTEYTWWDYRMLAFPKGNGVRIDHMLGTRTVADRSRRIWVDRDERKGTKPSDHAPVVLELGS